MKTLKPIFLISVALMLLFYPVSSKAITYSFDRITSNAPQNVESQLFLDVTGSGSTVTFKFYDIGSIASVVPDIYFFDGALLGATLSIADSDGALAGIN